MEAHGVELTRFDCMGRRQPAHHAPLGRRAGPRRRAPSPAKGAATRRRLALLLLDRDFLQAVMRRSLTRKRA